MARITGGGRMSTTATPAPPATSLPIWPGTPPEYDDSSREQMVVACDGGEQVAEAWVAQIRTRGLEPLQIHVRARSAAETHLYEADRDLIGLPQLRRVLQTANVGLRLLVAGCEWQVLTVLRVAIECGMIHDEIRAHATGDPQRIVVFCVHCEAEFLSPNVLGGDPTTCPRCRRHLEVHPHVNSSAARYLGSDADAGVLL